MASRVLDGHPLVCGECRDGPGAVKAADTGVLLATKRIVGQTIYLHLFNAAPQPPCESDRIPPYIALASEYDIEFRYHEVRLLRGRAQLTISLPIRDKVYLHTVASVSSCNCDVTILKRGRTCDRLHVV
jgi:hypothetical protein